MTSRAVNPIDMAVEIVDHRGGCGRHQEMALSAIMTELNGELQQAYPKSNKKQSCLFPKHVPQLELGQCPRSTRTISMSTRIDGKKLLADHRGSSAYVPADGSSMSEK